jgi:AcrR family transcriptional regulator
MVPAASAASGDTPLVVRGDKGEGPGTAVLFAQPKQNRSQESARRLLDAAEDLVAERGYGHATLAAIGARAGYSRGLVSARFGSKENLMWAVVQRATESWFRRLVDPPREGSGLEQLVALIRLIGEHNARDPHALRVLERLIFEVSGSNHELQARLVASQRLMERQIGELVHRGVQDGSVRPDADAEIEAALIVATLRGIGYQWFLYPDEVDILRLHGGFAAQLQERLGGPEARSFPGDHDR